MTASGGVWRNWGRTESARPARVERPVDAAAVQRAVRAAVRQGQRVKAVGSGHSFSGIAVAPGILLEPGFRDDLIDLDLGRNRVTVDAATPLWRLTRMLREHGLALQNLGDIDRQTLAGATSTGTHGTGGAFSGLAAQITGAQLVTGTGDLLEINDQHNAELLPAVRVGLGSLGILTALTLQCVPAFVLHAVERAEALDGVLDGFLERCAAEDHFEFYWFPHTDVALTKTNTRRPMTSARHPLSARARWRDDEVLSNGVYRALCATGALVPAIVPPVNRLATRLTGTREFSDWSHRVFTTRRRVRFQELEYALPRAAVPEVLREIRTLINVRGWRISFPVEVRSAAADDVWLSTAYERDTGYIAVHRYYRENAEPYFRAVEEIMKAHDGRPHWGKMHWRTRSDFEGLYPRFADFLAVRDRLDPERVFANRYLDRVLGA